MKTQMDASVWLGTGAQFEVRGDGTSTTYVSISDEHGTKVVSLFTMGTVSEKRDMLMRLRDALDTHLNATADAAMAARSAEAGA